MILKYTEIIILYIRAEYLDITTKYTSPIVEYLNRYWL